MQARSHQNGALRGLADAGAARASEGKKVLTASPRRPGRAGQAKLSSIQQQIALENEKLLGHPYFHLCRTKAMSRDHLLGVVKQMYGFSLLFERLVTRRIAESSSDTDERVLSLARQLLREEIGHPELFYECLRKSGLSKDELARASPNTFLRALYGYLLATIQHENEYVGNIAMMQVMETIGLHVFGATLPAVQQYDLASTFLKQHADDDEAHSQMGLDLIPSFDEPTMSTSRRVISDVYRIVHFVLDDFVTLGKPRVSREGKA
ncbi:MAG TPA: iron-containing redox enzyme family protein [Polyangia bacterium]|jgi:hypothetical protein|nr:iron-containing redox enzyme family protein [Polyangia bacterium]